MENSLPHHVIVMDLDGAWRNAKCTGKPMNTNQYLNSATMLRQIFGSTTEIIGLLPECTYHLPVPDHFTQIMTLNGNRPYEIGRLLHKFKEQAQKKLLRQVIFITADRDLACELQQLAHSVKVVVCCLDPDIHSLFQGRGYRCTSWEELLKPCNTRSNKVQIWVDLENILIGLQQRNIHFSVPELVAAIRRAAAELGELGQIHVCADFTRIQGGEYIHQFEQQNARTYPVQSTPHKNSADMKIAHQIRDWFENKPLSSGETETILILSCDSDFTETIIAGKQHGRRMIIMGLNNDIGRSLQLIADQVLYLEKYYRTVSLQFSIPTLAPDNELIIWTLRVIRCFNQKHYQWIWVKELQAVFDSYEDAASHIEMLRQAKILIPCGDNRVCLDRQHIYVRSLYTLLRWIKKQIPYAINMLGLRYVDTNFLARGMRMESGIRCQNLGQTFSQAEAWLNLFKKEGFLKTQEIDHPKDPTKILTTWHLT